MQEETSSAPSPVHGTSPRTAPVRPRMVIIRRKLVSSLNGYCCLTAAGSLKPACPRRDKQTRNVPSAERHLYSSCRTAIRRSLLIKLKHSVDLNMSSTSGHQLAVCVGNKFVRTFPARAESSISRGHAVFTWHRDRVMISLPLSPNFSTFAEHVLVSMAQCDPLLRGIRLLAHACA